MSDIAKLLHANGCGPEYSEVATRYCLKRPSFGNDDDRDSSALISDLRQGNGGAKDFELAART